MRNLMHRLLTITALLLLPAAAAAQVQNDARPADHERWFVLKLMGQRAGWAYERVTHKSDRIITESHMQISMSRSGIPLEVAMGSRFEETHDGEPIAAHTDQDFGAMTTVTDITFDGDVAQIVTRSGDSVQSRDEPLSKDKWMPPEASMRYARKQLNAGTDSVTFKTIMPEAGLQPIEVTFKKVDDVSIEVYGRTVPATQYDMIVSLMPGMVNTAYVDANLRTLKMTMNVGGMPMDMLAADEQLAKSEWESPEVMVNTLVKLPQAINNPRAVRRATYLMRLSEGEFVELPTSGHYQTARARDDGSVEVTVDMDRPAGKASVDEPALNRSTMIDGSDAEVIKLMKQATAGAGDDPAKRAEAMRRFVYQYIDAKTLGVGFATASEVARTATGDCSEHAVLLAALLRADGIPSRTASGLVYAERFAGEHGVMAYHMWTQAFLNGAWIDLDATMDERQPFDAAHIAIDVSTMDDGEMINGMVTLVPLIGRLSVEVQGDLAY